MRRDNQKTISVVVIRGDATTDVKIHDGATVREVLDSLGIKGEPRCLCNGRDVTMDCICDNKDVIEVTPNLTGAVTELERAIEEFKKILGLG